jgi:hypothetical protein
MNLAIKQFTDLKAVCNLFLSTFPTCLFFRSYLSKWTGRKNDLDLEPVREFQCWLKHYLLKSGAGFDKLFSEMGNHS